jgi:hypothetical protein
MFNNNLREKLELVESSTGLCSLAQEFPNQREDIFQYLINNFNRLVTNSTELGNLAGDFKEHKEELFQLLCEPENFKRLVINATQLGNLAGDFKEYKEELFQLLCEPENFKRLVENHVQLSNLARDFPGHDSIFKQPTVEKAFNTLLMESKSSKAFTEGATIGALSAPVEISSHVSSFLGRTEGGRLAQTHKLANTIAKENEMEEKNKLRPVKK